MKLVVKFFAVTAVVGLLAGCSGGSSSLDSGENFGSYKCTAIGTGGDSVGWAANQGRARDIAMEKCRSRGGNPDACRITQCVGE
jgi:hypothetical protein